MATAVVIYGHEYFYGGQGIQSCMPVSSCSDGWDFLLLLFSLFFKLTVVPFGYVFITFHSNLIRLRATAIVYVIKFYTFFHRNSAKPEVFKAQKLFPWKVVQILGIKRNIGIELFGRKDAFFIEAAFGNKRILFCGRKEKKIIKIRIVDCNRK